jgi:hypothetical protein
MGAISGAPHDLPFMTESLLAASQQLTYNVFSF